MGSKLLIFLVVFGAVFFAPRDEASVPVEQNGIVHYAILNVDGVYLADFGIRDAFASPDCKVGIIPPGPKLKTEEELERGRVGIPKKCQVKAGSVFRARNRHQAFSNGMRESRRSFDRTLITET